MSSLINPVGPEEPSTYWRRRAIIIVAVIVAVWLVWFGVRTVTGSDEAPDPPASPVASPAASAPAAPSPSDEAASPQAASSEGQVAQAAVVDECGDDAITVSVEVPQATTVGTGATATMTVTNTGSRPCRRDLGAGANEVRITSGSALVWSSDFCGASDAADEKVLQPGAAWSTEISWPGRVTTSDCPTDQPTAQPGGYRAVARNGEIQSQAAVLAVR